MPRNQDQRDQDTNLVAVRDLLLAAFDPDSFRQLFYFSDNPRLTPVYQHLSTQQSLPTMVEQAISYCERHRALPDLLRAVQKANPEQYNLYKDRLCRTPLPALTETMPAAASPPSGAGVPGQTPLPTQQSGGREQLPPAATVPPSDHRERGWRVRVSRHPVLAATGLLVIVGLCVALGTWLGPDIYSILFPTPTVVAQVTPSPSPTAMKETPSPTPTPSDTPTPTSTNAPVTPTRTPTPTLTPTPTPTSTPSLTPTPSPTPTRTATRAPTHTPTLVPCEGDTTGDLTAQLFQAYDNGNYAKALACSFELERRWSVEAKQQQAKKQASGCRYTPNPADQAALDSFWREYWALNDVATGLFMRAEIFRIQGKCQEAKPIYKQVIDKYPCAFAWNPDNGGFFWNVADGAQVGYRACP